MSPPTHPLKGTTPSPLPAALRDPVLAAAQSAVGADDAVTEQHWIDRLWTNRGLRLAWAGWVLVFLVLNLTSGWERRSVPRPEGPTVRVTTLEALLAQEVSRHRTPAEWLADGKMGR